MDLTLDQCFELSFNTTYDGFPCPPEKIHSSSIPTLKDVLLDLKTTQTKIKIELKGPNTVEPTLKLIEELDMVHQCQYSSFQLDRLRLLRQLRPQRNEKTGEYVYATGALFGANVPSDYIERALSIGASQVHLRYDTCTVERVAAIRKAGLTSMVYFRGPLAMMMDAASFNDVGFEDERCYQALIDTGVDQLCVNRPDLLMRMVRSQYKNK
jgi:glycerophosphoryl diester phosphodiesterase